LYKWLKKGSSNSKINTSLKKTDGDVTITPVETACLLLKTLIPHDGTEITLTIRQVGPLVAVNLTTDEVKEAIRRIGPKKAPGKDGLTAAIIRKHGQ